MNEYLALLRQNANYRRLWLGSVVSQLGDWFNLLASAELIATLTSSGVALSYLFLARFLPLFIFSPIAGVLADRFDRRRIMILSDLMRAGIVLAFLLVRSAEQVWIFYLLMVLQFSLSALFVPARTAVLANVVAEKDLVTANALDSLTWSTMLALGAFLGGLVAALFGVAAAFVADALTFLLSAWFISRIDLLGRVATAGGRPLTSGILMAGALPTPSSSSFDSAQDRPALPPPRRFAALEGFRYLLQEPFVLGIALAKAGGSLVWGAINVLEVTYANELFGPRLPVWLGVEDTGTAVLGLIYFTAGLGTGLGPLVLRRWLGDAPRRLFSGISAGFLLMIAGIWSLAQAPTLSLFLLATLVRTIGTGTLWVFSAALLQMLVPDDYRGRVFAFEFAVLTLTQSISIYLAGTLQDRGWAVQQVTLALAGLAVITATTWLVFHLSNRAALHAGRLPLRVAREAELLD
jgi:MFS family permease